MKLVTATILSRFDLALVKKRPMLPVRRGLTLAPPASFKMTLKKKQVKVSILNSEQKIHKSESDFNKKKNLQQKNRDKVQ